MGRLVGVGATKAPKMYNAEEVAALTADLEAKVKELTETKKKSKSEE